MKNYKRLSLEEREEISRMLVQSCSLNEIAKVLNRHISSISREVCAGGCDKYTYRAGKAQRRAERNSRKRARKANKNSSLTLSLCDMFAKN